MNEQDKRNKDKERNKTTRMRRYERIDRQDTKVDTYSLHIQVQNDKL